ncbi:N-6 DNA methylase [Dictyobacter formicarum]|uniref:site-specific DNA-methyltransferase (adenine-specific) n=1 Tax=Dictyobacter formicarum TaxID=2778368 RepID=A0ABQ3VHH5_9CHLR|nr:N-6 DNA methylase [Dictyobacter formicarum]GHO85258.1 hypothetical protein KSZ_32640 [Dictyobacter formicarum]
MLNQETKRRIDTARDILVGKEPDPKAQVAQITTALIYKFMDDMDKESVDLGGDPSFFVGEYAKYSWDKLLDSRLGGIARLNLYIEALEKMPLNPELPELFRNILKGAFLPYRDPETLNLFLKQINAFSYDHSEKLGDAFEYLLSILGSQGDAGQFRTPRHIIDFIVAVLDPQKNETILDPACGTAGFLISSYKHILRQNTKEYPGDLLNPDDKEKLMSNFVGYDISPDMVRLSLVNMYLHGFQNPQGYEYDSLTSEERWDETFDIIMANPPFMSPKGGIRPHTRFSIPASRSEILFVDYIAEHLNNHGRAGIIVPEGIIFQSGKSYKALRKMLVEKYLWAVVSLPSGVFQPYSGVKTSILFMDKNLASKTDSILFVKVENDGFDLGAQRRPIAKNDLPQTLRTLHQYARDLQENITIQSYLNQEENISLATIVQKTKIAKNGDYNLSGDRYRNNQFKRHAKWPFIELGKIAQNLDSKRKPITKSDRIAGIYPYYGASGIVDYVEGYLFDEDLLLVSEDGANLLTRNTPIAFSISGKTWVNNHAHILKFSNTATQKFVEVLLNSMNLENHITGSAQPKLNQDSLNAIQIPLPPLKIQQEIVAELENYQKIIDGAKHVVAAWKPKIKVDPTWPSKQLGEIITLQRGYDLPKTQFKEGDVPVIGSNGIIGYHNEKKEKGPGVVTGRSGTIGKVHLIESDYFWPHNTALFVKEFNGNNCKFIKYLLESIDLKSLGDNVAAVPSLDRKNAHRVPVFLPPLEIQEQIVAQIEEEQKIINANKRLIEIFEQKIKDKISEVWLTEESEPLTVDTETAGTDNDIMDSAEIELEPGLPKTAENEEIETMPELVEIKQGSLFHLS